MPIRQVVRRTKTTVRYLVPSFKNGRAIGCESGLERDLVLLCEFSPIVTSYEEQPQKFRIAAEPKDFNAIPDLKVVLANAEIGFLEAKYKNKAMKLVDRHKQIGSHLETLGYSYQMLTEGQIRFNQIVIDNCLYLNGFRSHTKSDFSELLSYVPKGNFTLAELIKKLGDPQLAVKLIALQLIYHDYTKILSQKSELRASRSDDFNFLTNFLK